jgi:outer membrane protein OmpA-like peptidoglycan-associated protein
MRHLFTVGLLLSIAACALIEPSGRRFVVYFDPSSAQLMDSAKAVVVAAGDWGKRHPEMPVIVAAYADPYGSQQANADFTRLRAQVVIDALVSNGVPATRIQRQDIGSVKFEVDSHESRRVEIIVGSP